MLSPGYADYLKTFGLEKEQPGADHGPAFVILDRQLSLSSHLEGIVTIFTVGFAHPIHPDTPTISRVGTLYISPDIAYLRLGLPQCDNRAWLIEPQLVGDRMVKKGVVLQSWNAAQWRTREDRIAVYKAVDQDVEARKEWRLKVEALNPLYIDEATWDFTAYEDDDSRSDFSTGSAEPGTEEFNRRVLAGVTAEMDKWYPQHSSASR